MLGSAGKPKTPDLVLVTGATDGIGLELVRYYVAKGDRVIATGRRAVADLPEGFPQEARYVPADQTNLANVNVIIEAIAARDEPIVNVAILNAGVGFSSDAGAEDPANIEQTLTANLDFNVLLSQALLQHMHKVQDGWRHIGHLALIGSVAHRGAAKFPSYAATKAGLHGLARALREEWRGRVAVQIIHPGPTRTAMHHKAGFDATNMQWMFLKPDWMARNIAIAIEAGRPRVKLSHGTWLMSRLHWLDGPIRHFRKVPR
ncbi:MAG: SDR family NAD(P)-dependent oxidoreductase [Pseudomonadota bacterium]